MKIDAWQFFEYLSFILSLIYYKGLRAYSLQLMVPFLLYICCSESLAAHYIELGMPSTRGFNNTYCVISAGVFFALFHGMIKPKGVFDLIYRSVAIISIVFFLYDILDSNIYESNQYTVVISLVQQIFLALILLFKLAFNEDSKVSIVKEPYFWIGVGVLIFSLAVVVILGLQPFIYRNQINISGKSAYRTIVPIGCVILYSCYSYAFYLASKSRKSFQVAATTTL